MTVSITTRKGADGRATIPVMANPDDYTDFKIHLGRNSKFVTPVATYPAFIDNDNERSVAVGLPAAFIDGFKDGYYRIVGTRVSDNVVRVLQTGTVDFVEEGPKPGLSATAEASIKELIGAGGGGGGGVPTVYNSQVFSTYSDLLSTDTVETNPDLVVEIEWNNPMPTLDYEVKLDYPVVKTMERHWIEIPPLPAGMATGIMITWDKWQDGSSYEPGVMPLGEKFPGKIQFDYKVGSEASAYCWNDTAVATTKSYYAEVWLDTVHLEYPLTVVLIDSQKVIDNLTVELTLKVMPAFGGGVGTLPAGTRIIATALSPKYIAG